MAPKKRSRSDEQAVKYNTTSSRVTRSLTTRQAKANTNSTPVKNTAKTKVESSVKKAVAEAADGTKTIVIEHCKQCSQFKTRAIKVKDALENGIAEITVLVNPEKNLISEKFPNSRIMPRRGCFEVREKGGEIFISLLDMKRPFSPMRALDMDKVISDIIDKIK